MVVRIDVQLLIMPRSSKFLSGLFSARDEQLMWRVKLEDDHHAFADLMLRWQRPIHDLCARMTGDVHRAEDLAQTVFTRVFARRADWQPSAKFSTFLWRVALNLCRDELRKRQRRGECSLEDLTADEASESSFLAVDEPAPDLIAEANERAELVRQALLKLVHTIARWSSCGIMSSSSSMKLERCWTSRRGPSNREWPRH